MNINYEELLKIIQGELYDYVNSPENYDTYKDYKFVLSSEQQFMKLKDKNPNTFYIVVKFNSADILFGQTVVPIQISVLSEENKLITAQKLMTDFAEEYNLKRTSNNTIQQIWESPSVVGNFNPLYAGYRSLIKVSGALIITKNAAYYELYYVYGEDENHNKLTQQIPTISTAFNLVCNPDTQPFYNSNDFTKSIITFGSFSITFTTFLISDNFMVNKVIDLLTGAHTDLEKADDEWNVNIERDNDGNIKYPHDTKVNDTIDILVKFLDGRTRTCKMKITTFQVQEQVGEIPVLTLGLSE